MADAHPFAQLHKICAICSRLKKKERLGLTIKPHVVVHILLCDNAQLHKICAICSRMKKKDCAGQLNHMLFYIFSCVTKGLACCWPYDIMLSCSLSYFIT
jgi:hypothetical protein